MFKISAEAYAKNCVYYMIDKEKKVRVRNKDIEEKLDAENIYDLIDNKIKCK